MKTISQSINEMKTRKNVAVAIPGTRKQRSRDTDKGEKLYTEKDMKDAWHKGTSAGMGTNEPRDRRFGNNLEDEWKKDWAKLKK